ncbi:MAG: mechanosensitive ion channel family protein [Thermodesulfovibrionales bacterium]|nr:mechanosensitive ion channel family protein [Thermodesulfovibrionales bacterium]
MQDIGLVTLSLLITVASFVILLIIRSLILRQIKIIVSKTPYQIDTIILKSIKMPSIFLCLALSIFIGLEVINLPVKQHETANKVLYILIIFSVSLAIANVVSRLFKNYVDRLEIPFPSTKLFYGILKGVIIAIGLVIILSVLGISIAPVLTALGVGGLAVALALKDTLENLFAGMHILFEKTIRVGDFIRLENGQEGFVEDITWRTTRIKTVQNNMVIIPNSKLSQSIVLNLSLPDNKMSLNIPISVSYDSDIKKVEDILIDEVKKAMTEVKDIVEDFEPIVRLNPGFSESSIDFTLICQIRHPDKQYIVAHELRKRIFKRFKEEGIEIPYPQRVVHLVTPR